MMYHQQAKSCTECGSPYWDESVHECNRTVWENYQVKKAKPDKIQEEFDAWMETAEGRFAQYRAARGVSQ